MWHGNKYKLKHIDLIDSDIDQWHDGASAMLVTATYIDEAVVEEHAEDGGAHPLLLPHGGSHPRPHDGEQLRARLGVEVGRELLSRGAAKNGEDDGEGKEGCRPGEDGHVCS